MTTPQTKKRTNSVQRTAFTLVELLVVIVIIGILAGIAAPFIFGAIRRAREFTIQNEIVQIDAGVRKFETEHGFFPPTIGPGFEVDTPAKFLRYLNRIAPNHAEGTATSGGGLARWWSTVGSQLDQDSSLVFWLSGLCTSKQYPLSGSAALLGQNIVLAPYDANRDASDAELPNGVNISRNVSFEFNAGQLVSNGSVAGIKSYYQPQGKGDALAYLYRDSKSYVQTDQTGQPTGFAYHVLDSNNNPVFFNPESFQIIGPGMDGAISNINPPVTDITDEGNVDPAQDDNITNFSGGRLERSYGG